MSTQNRWLEELAERAKPKGIPPTKTRERGSKMQITSVKLTPELRAWVEKAAYRQGMTVSAFLRVAARNEADRVLGYNRDNRHTRLPTRNYEGLEKINADTRARYNPTDDGGVEP